LTANLLGAEARGEIALVILGVSISGLFQSIVGASAITYLLPKNSLKQLLLIAVLWSVSMAFLVNVVLDLTMITPDGRLWFLVGISLPQGLIFITQSILIAKRKIHWYNRIEYLRSAFLLASAFLFLWSNSLSIETIFMSYIIANVITAIIGFYFIAQLEHAVEKLNSWTEAFKSLFKYGFEIQLNNISQMINYRFVYFLIEKWKGMDALGVFSVTVAIAETVWIISKSVATYQTSQLVNLKDRFEQAKMTVFYVKISGVATFIALGVVLLLPSQFFTWIFGKDFSDISLLLPYLAPGILFLSIFAILNHYFYAVNSNWVNIRSAILGNVISVLSGLALIYYYDLPGAALVYSVTFLGMLLFLIIAFTRKTEVKLEDFKIKKEDFKMLKV
jgi:O-antigen/teichoic acid export membrane protein